MKTVLCKLCRKEPASSLSWFGDRRRQRQSDQWSTFAGNSTSRVETFYVYLAEIETPEREQHWREHLRTKRWFDETDLNAAIQRFRTAKTKRGPVCGSR